MSRLQILAVFVCVCGIPAVATAQRGSFGGGSSGGFGSSAGSFGSGSTNAGAMGMGAGSSMFGAGGGMFGNTGGFGATGGGGTASSGFGAGGGIQSGLNLGVGSGMVGQNAYVGMMNQNGGFVGDRRVGSGMLGGQYGAGGGQFGGFGGGGRSRFSGFGGRGGRDNNWNNNGDGGDEGQLTIRPTLKIGFDVDTSGTIVANPEFAAKFAQMVERAPELAGVTYEVDENGRVVLGGTVPNEEAKGLAKVLFRLRPGVRDIVDEMTVAGAAGE